MIRLVVALLWAILALIVWSSIKVTAWFVRHKRLKRQHGCKSPPVYPHRDIVLGRDLYKDDLASYVRGDTFEVYRARFARLGLTYRVRSMGRTVIHTMDSANVQAILSLDAESFGVGPLRQPWAGAFLGHGIFLSDGADWARSRALLKPIFTRTQIADFSMFSKHVERALAIVPKDGSTVDLQSLFKRLFLDVSTEFIFGESTDSLLEKSAKPEVAEFLETFDEAMNHLRQDNELGILWYLKGANQKRDEAFAAVHRFVDDLIKRAVARHQRGEYDGGDEERCTVLVNEILRQTGDRDYLRRELLNVFTAARDTAAVALAEVFFQLARHPDAWARLRAEALAIDRPLSFELLKSMRYLQNVLRECLRLIGPAGLTQRICLADAAVLPRGGGPDGLSPVLVRRGTVVICNFNAMQQSTATWGADAAQFRPDRWRDARPGWDFLPFLGGPRICPAQQLALAQMAYVVVRFVRLFPACEPRAGGSAFVEDVKMLIESRGGVQVGFSPPA